MRACRVNLNLIELVYFEWSASEHSDMELILKLGANSCILKSSYSHMIISYLHHTWVECWSDLFAVVSILCTDGSLLTRQKLISRKLLEKQLIVQLDNLYFHLWVFVLIIPDDKCCATMCYYRNARYRIRCFKLREIQPTRSEKYMFRIWHMYSFQHIGALGHYRKYLR